MAAFPEIRDHQTALAYLFGRIDYERTVKLPYRSRGLKLDRMRRLCTLLGDPQTKYPIVHVAGTKGKGSTATMIAAILAAAGYRTGLYTSPHLESVEERISIAGRQCTEGQFVDLIARIRPAADTLEAEPGGDADAGTPTFFEITTAAAMLHFADQQVDAAVLEVGLGGRLDSTNVCQPAVSVITTISFDHMKQLGNTLAAIASEKAGIIKPGVPVVSGVVPDEPRLVIEQIAAERGSRLVALGRDFSYAYHGPVETHPGTPIDVDWHGEVEYRALRGNAGEAAPRLRLGMPGRHQAANAAVALATIGCLREQGWHIPDAAVRRGVAEAWCPARTEIVALHPAVVIDAAHNVASIGALDAVLDELFPDRQRRILVFAASQDKDVAGMLRALLPRFNGAFLTRFLNNPRAAAPEALAAAANAVLTEAGRTDCQVATAPDPASAWSAARAVASPSDLICIAGSFFLAAELRGAIRRELEP